jgi:plastocyanin
MRHALSIAAVLVGVLVGGLGCKSATSPAAPTPAPVAIAPAPAAPAAPAAVPGKVTMAVTDKGFEPERIPAKKGQPITLAITRTTDHTCAREITFQGQDGKTPLPLGKTVEVTYTPKASGEIKFGCAMGMMVSGVLAVTD